MSLITAIGTLLAVNLLNAHFDWYKIKAHKEVKHGLNLATYLCAVLILAYSLKLDTALFIIFIINSLCFRQFAFDIPLNLRRKLPWNYVTSADPPGSIWDRFEIWVFGRNGTDPFIVYGWLYIVSMALLILG